MPRFISFRLVAACALALALSLTLVAAAVAKTTASLRVVGSGNKVLVEKTLAAATTSVKTSSKASCFGAGTGGSGKSVAIAGTTALGLLARGAQSTGSLRPLLETAAAHDRGVFVLAATSNPEGGTVQRATFDGRTVAQLVVDQAAVVNRSATPSGPGYVGVVLGATVFQAPDVSALGGPVLVPGVGAQGGRPEALGGLGGAVPGQLLPAVAREVLRAGPSVSDLRAAGQQMLDAVAYLAVP